MADVIYKKGQSANLDDVAIAEGQILVTEDTGEMYVDMSDGTRKKISDMTTAGRKTAEGGEIFNDYENNQSISKYSTTVGSHNIAGSKCFKVIADPIDNGDGTGIYMLDSIEGLETDMRYSAFLETQSVDAGKILSINADTKEVAVDGFVYYPLNPNTDNPETLEIYNSFIITGRPDLGTTDIGFAAFAGGENSFAQNSHVVTFGEGNYGLGKYATTFGINNISAYNATTLGQGNKNLGATSLVTGVNNTATVNRVFVSGKNNTANGADSFIGGGHDNTTQGEGSAAFNFGNKALGYGSVAFGFENEASGSLSFTTGQNNKPTGKRTAAFGRSNTVAGENAAAFGLGNNIGENATNSVAFGERNEITGSHSLTSGTNNNVAGTGSIVSGAHNTLNGNQTTAFGCSNTVKGENGAAFGFGNFIGENATNSVAFGERNEITSSYSLVSGINNNIAGANSIASGYHNTLNSNGGCAFGRLNEVSGTQSGCIGNENTVSKSYSVALNANNTVNGERSLVIGSYNTVNGMHSFAGGNSCVIGENGKSTFCLGRVLKSDVPYQTVVGQYNNSNADALFVVGNGVDNASWGRKNAFTVHKDGHSEVQLVSTDSDLSVINKQYLESELSKLIGYGTGEPTDTSYKLWIQIEE